MGMGISHVSVYHISCLVAAEARRGVDPLELELQMIVSCHIVAEDGNPGHSTLLKRSGVSFSLPVCSKGASCSISDFPIDVLPTH